MAAAICTVCYEQLCPHGAAPGTPCSSIVGGANTFKLNGNYTGQFKNLLPPMAREADALHFDILTGLLAGAGVAGPMSPAHTALLALLTTDAITIADLHNTIYFLTMHPMHYEDVVRNGSRLMGTATAAQQKIVDTVLRAASEARALVSTPIAGASTAKAFKQAQAPRAMFFQLIIKATESGAMATENQSLVFDPVTGKALTPFEKMVKASTGAKLMYAVSSFCQAMCIAKGEAPTVYYRFQREIMRVADTHGVFMGHKLADIILRKVDDGTYANIVVLFQQGEHNRMLADLLQERNITNDGFEAGKERIPKSAEEKVDPRTRVVFGPVKQPVGGPGAGIITHFRTGVKLKCNKFHATPQLPCTAGVPNGHPGVPKASFGICAYEH